MYRSKSISKLGKGKGEVEYLPLFIKNNSSLINMNKSNSRSFDLNMKVALDKQKNELDLNLDFEIDKLFDEDVSAGNFLEELEHMEGKCVVQPKVNRKPLGRPTPKKEAEPRSRSVPAFAITNTQDSFHKSEVKTCVPRSVILERYTKKLRPRRNKIQTNANNNASEEKVAKAIVTNTKPNDKKVAKKPLALNVESKNVGVRGSSFNRKSNLSEGIVTKKLSTAKFGVESKPSTLDKGARGSQHKAQTTPVVKQPINDNKKIFHTSKFVLDKEKLKSINVAKKSKSPRTVKNTSIVKFQNFHFLNVPPAGLKEKKLKKSTAGEESAKDLPKSMNSAVNAYASHLQTQIVATKLQQAPTKKKIVVRKKSPTSNMAASVKGFKKCAVALRPKPQLSNTEGAIPIVKVK